MSDNIDTTTATRLLRLKGNILEICFRLLQRSSRIIPDCRPWIPPAQRCTFFSGFRSENCLPWSHLQRHDIDLIIILLIWWCIIFMSLLFYSPNMVEHCAVTEFWVFNPSAISKTLPKPLQGAIQEQKLTDRYANNCLPDCPGAAAIAYLRLSNLFPFDVSDSKIDRVVRSKKSIS